MLHIDEVKPKTIILPGAPPLIRVVEPLDAPARWPFVLDVHFKPGIAPMSRSPLQRNQKRTCLWYELDARPLTLHSGNQGLPQSIRPDRELAARFYEISLPTRQGPDASPPRARSARATCT
jgi:hypothetical protein